MCIRDRTSTILETAMVESTTTTKDYSGEINSPKEGLHGEVEWLRMEIKG